MKKLVGQGKPFHSAVDKAAGMLKRKVGTGAEFMKELMGITGIKPTEIQERGLNEVMGMPKMTHEQFMTALASKPAPAIEEKVFANKLLRNPGADPDPHHEQYTLPGGDNYREMLIKAPKGVDNQEKIMELEAKIRHIPMFNSTPQQQADIAKYHNQIRDLKAEEAASPKPFPGVYHHFGGEPGILASMRLKDRLMPDLEGEHNVKIIGGGGISNKKFKTRAEAEAFANVKHQGGYRTELTPLNNKKLLHLEELQSDWHQQGREKGYGDKLRNGWKFVEQEPGFFYLQKEDMNMPMASGTKEEVMKRARHYGAIDKGVPDAPFKKNWEEVALKRLIHHAAEKGYHGIVVTPGQEQADRYSLAKHVDEISHNPRTNMATGEKSKSVRIDMKSGSPVQLGVANSGVIDNVNNPDHTNLIGKHLADVVGKDLAKNIMSEERGILSPQDLTVGGEGMKAFYDTKVPNILNSIGKKYGVKTQLNGHKLRDPNGRSDAAMKLGVTPQQYAAMSPDERNAFHEKLDDMNAKPLHHFPITEEMRKDVLANGLPLYAGGGEVDAEEVFMGKGGKVKEPKSTVKAYKLFRVDERHPGKLFPLFVNANQPVEMNKWVNAEVGPQTDKGKVKSKLGPLAYRPGWHSGDLPVATHIGEGGAPPTHRPRNHAWAEVEVPNDVDWQTEANKRGINKQGKLIAREAHITDQIPKGGHYRYKTNPNMTGNWLISGSMKVNKVLSHPEVERINKKAGVSDLPRKEPFNKKDFGFKYGGDVDVESYFFPNKE